LCLHPLQWKVYRYYIGQTQDFNERLLRHNSGYDQSTNLYFTKKGILGFAKYSFGYTRCSFKFDIWWKRSLFG